MATLLSSHPHQHQPNLLTPNLKSIPDPSKWTMLMFVCINVLIQHFYDWVAFNDTLPHTLVSWQSLSIMAQSFQMLFYMWEGNKMFCMSQIFLKHFQMLIQYTAWNRMDAISASMSSSHTLSKLWLEISVCWLSRHFRQTCRSFECRDRCSLRKWTQCNPFVFPSSRNPLGGGSSRQLSVCKGVSVPFRLDLKSRWSNVPPSPTLSSTLAWMLHYLRTCI